MNNEHDQACYLRTVLMQKDEGWMILMKQQKIIGLETVLTPWPCKECKAIKCKSGKLEDKKNESKLEFELKLNMLYKELVKTQAKIEVLEDENLKFKEEMCELRSTPRTVPRLPRRDERILPAIDRSMAVTGISSLQTELLVYNAMMKNNPERADLHIAVNWVNIAAMKLLSGTKEQVSRALYILSKSLYTKRSKNMFVGSFNDASLENVLQPSEYALVCGFETTLKKFPDMTQILLSFCSKLEFELLNNGQLSHCRVYAAICKLLNEPYIAFRICKDLLLTKKAKGLIFVAMIGCIYPDVLLAHYNPDELTNIETKVFFNFILSKPETMMQVEQCHYIFRNMCHLPASPAFMMEDIAEDVLQHLIQDFLQDSPDDPMPSLLCVKLLKLEMGYSWLVSNVLDPFFQRVGNEKNRHLKKLSQILKIYSEVEN